MADKILALILARAGSKGVPGKNIKNLGAKPLIAYSIEAAKNAPGIDRVVVSTDSEEIANISKFYGAEVPFLRPKSLAGDTASSLGAMKHALEWLEENQNYNPDALFLLQPTSPFRRSWQIEESIDLYKKSGKETVIGVKEISEGHPLWIVKDQQDLEWYIPGDRPSRRQDLPKAYSINGAVYLTKADYYKRAVDPMPGYNQDDAVIYPMNSVTSVDINEPIDFALAETLVANQDFNTWVQNPNENKAKLKSISA